MKSRIAEALDAPEDRQTLFQRHAEFYNPGFIRLMNMVNFGKYFVRAEGCHLFDDEGNDYLDFLSGYGSISFGHNPPRIWKAIEEVASRKMPNFFHLSPVRLAGILAEKLVKLVGFQNGNTIYANSGAEAVEAAMRLARAATGKPGFISIKGCHHGLTYGPLSLRPTGLSEAFAPLLPNCRQIPMNDIEALEREMAKGDVAAVVLEPTQGAGGVKSLTLEFVRAVRELCNKHKAVMIMDEIQTGLGRMGYLFAFQKWGIFPDVVTLGKALSGGCIPIAVAVAEARWWKKAFGPLERCLAEITTFGGSTIACAAAFEALEMASDKTFLEEVVRKGGLLGTGLERLRSAHRIVKDVRGEGLLWGLELKSPEGPLLGPGGEGKLGKLVKQMVGHWPVLCLMNDHRIISDVCALDATVMRIQPPLIVEDDEIARFLTALDAVLSQHPTPASLIRPCIWEFAKSLF